jgi:peroxiredoxin
MAIKVGDTAPDFTLPNQAGEAVTLSSFRGQKAVVLYFYPKDDTPRLHGRIVLVSRSLRRLCGGRG